MKRSEYENIKVRSREFFDRARIVVTEEEWNSYEIVDYCLNDFNKVGLGIVVYVNTDRVCAKELVLFPNQHSPEHRHPNVAGRSGKEEVFRCRYGECYLYVEGRRTSKPVCEPPELCSPWCTVWHEVILKPGDQYTIVPDTLHWFQAGPSGCIVSEFSTHSDDSSDVFTNPHIDRLSGIED